MRHPITHLRELEGRRGRCIRITTNGGRTWRYAMVVNQPSRRQGNKQGCDVAMEVRGRTHETLFLTDAMLQQATCIVEPATDAEVKNKQWASGGTPAILRPRRS